MAEPEHCCDYGCHERQRIGCREIVVATGYRAGEVEAHLIGYSGDAYGKTVTLETEKFLRNYKLFFFVHEKIEKGQC